MFLIMSSPFDAILSLDQIFPFHAIISILLASLMGTATIVWWTRMRKIGGIAGICFTLFFFFTTGFAILAYLYPTAPNQRIATNYGVIAFMCANTCWFFLFIAGEYSYSDRPMVWRVILVVIGYGAVISGLITTFFLPLGSGLLFMTYTAPFGWVLNLSFSLFILNASYAFIALVLFIQFCYRGIRAAPKNKFGSHVRKLFIALSLGLWIDCCLVAFTLNPEATAIIGPSLIMANTSIFQIIAFFLLFREYRIIYFMPHRAVGIFVVDASGQVIFNYIFQTQEVTVEGNLLGPALNAINKVVHETLNLPKFEWIQELRTASQTFILDIRSNDDLVGLLVVSKSTPLLRKALSTFLDTLIAKKAIVKTDANKVTREKNMELLEDLKITFPFISFYNENV